MERNRAIALIMAIVLCLSMLFSISFIVMEAGHGHDADQEHCATCLQIEACVNALGRLGLSIVRFFALLTLLISLLYAAGRLTYRRQFCTLISLKVKLTI